MTIQQRRERIVQRLKELGIDARLDERSCLVRKIERVVEYIFLGPKAVELFELKLGLK